MLDLDGSNTITVGGVTFIVTTVAPALTGGQVSVNYTAQSSDDFAGIASGITSVVNSNTSLAAIGVSASSSSNIIDISVNPATYFVSTSSGATETLTPGTNVLCKLVIKVGGTITAGDTLTVTTHNVALYGGTKANTYTVLAGDTLTSIADAIASLLSKDAELSGIGISATGQTVANMDWSQNFIGNVILAEGTNSITVSAVDAVPTTKNSNLQVLVKGPTEQTLEYDLNGNMTSDGTNTYEWDAENRLIQINYPGSGNDSQFAYDGRSRCTKIVEVTSGAITSTRQFVWSSKNRAEIRDASGALISQYFEFGQTISGVNYFYTKDQIGSVDELTDVSGNVQGQFSYSPYGQFTKVQGTLNPDFQFGALYMHVRSGLNLSKSRSYSSTLARWINRDTLGELGGVNLYDYSMNDPIDRSDPSGFASSYCDCTTQDCCTANEAQCAALHDDSCCATMYAACMSAVNNPDRSPFYGSFPGVNTWSKCRGKKPPPVKAPPNWGIPPNFEPNPMPLWLYILLLILTKGRSVLA